MAGHSKWANIQHRKKAQDARKGKLFTKLIRDITTAAKKGGEDKETNSWLRAAISKALAQNMTKDTIEKAIKRGIGGETDNFDEIQYEGYGPGGVAVLVDCLTDNRNRTVADVRHAFTKCGGNLGMEGSVAYLFIKRGLFSFPSHTNEQELMGVALEVGAEDLINNANGSIDLMTPPEIFEQVYEKLLTKGLKPDASEVTMLPASEVDLDKENAEKMLKLLEMLDDLDDVQNVHSNAKISDDILMELEKN